MVRLGLRGTVRRAGERLTFLLSIPAAFASIASAQPVGSLPDAPLPQTAVHASSQGRLGAVERVPVKARSGVLGFFSSSAVTYRRDAPPIDAREKFILASKLTVDPVVFGAVGVIAGVEQAANSYKSFGQGAAGYGRRYGATYGDFFTSIILGEAVFPSLFRQDPRYFAKIDGSVGSRTWYALSNAVIGQGDNRRIHVNYARLVGDVCSGGISNLYYPAADRHGAGLTFENAGFDVGIQAVANVALEFLANK